MRWTASPTAWPTCEKRTMVLLAAKLNSSVMTEAEHRMKTMAPETVEAAYRFPLSVTCTRFGTMMSCY
jgi:hypothetical protein